MNQSIAVAYATLGRELRALMLRVVMVNTVVTPVEDQTHRHLEYYKIKSSLQQKSKDELINKYTTGEKFGMI